MTDLTWVLSSCVLILAVAAIRAVFGARLRPGLRYALWGLVLLRLLAPFEIGGSAWSVASMADRLPEREVPGQLVMTAGDVPQPAPHVPGPPLPGSAQQELFTVESAAERTQDAAQPGIGPGGTPLAARDVLRGIWLAGIGVTAAVFLASNLRFFAQLRRRRRPLEAGCPLRTFAVENLSSSCLFGNTIYVAAETAADETRLRHVLAHELSHHRHGDHVWALLRCAALALHWYNPLVWWAAALSRQDSELCADAGALRRLGEEERESYGATLIELSARHAARASLLCTATTMTNGKKSLRERVTMVARRPRMTAAVVIAVAVIAAVAAGCAFTGAKTEPAAMTEEEALDALEASVEQWDDRGVRYVAFTLPEAYGQAENWGLHITGRAVYEDGMSMSMHYFEGESWKAGERYVIETTHLTELTMQAALTGQKGGLHEREIDLLAGRASGAFASVDAYLNHIRANMRTVTCHAANAGGETSANVLDTRVAYLEKDGELSGLAPDGTLELYSYLIETRIDIPLTDVVLAGGMYDAGDGWCDLEGQGGHSLVVLRHADGSVDALTDRPNNDDRGGLYYYEESAAELLYDWYVREHRLDLPLYTIDLLPADENGNYPARRWDGEGWYVYVPIQGWAEASAGGTARWVSQYNTGSLLAVRESSAEEKNAERPQLSEGQAERFVEAPDGTIWLVWTQYDPAGITDYPPIAIEPKLLTAMLESFTVVSGGASAHRVTGEMFGLTGPDAALYTAAADYLGAGVNGDYLMLPALEVWGDYPGEHGSTCYICGLLRWFWWDFDAADGSYASIGSDGMPMLITLSAEGRVIHMTGAADGADNTELIKTLCGPRQDIAALLNAGKDVAEHIPDARLLGSKSSDEMLARYLPYLRPSAPVSFTRYNGDGWHIDIPVSWTHWKTSGFDPETVEDGITFRPAMSGEWQGEGLSVLTLRRSAEEVLHEREQQGLTVDWASLSVDTAETHTRVYPLPDGRCCGVTRQDPTGRYDAVLRAMAESFAVASESAPQGADDRSAQLDLIAASSELWRAADESDGWAYAVTDLDRNGRLEILSAENHGTSHIGATRVWEVNEQFDALAACPTDEAAPAVLQPNSYYDAGNGIPQVYEAWYAPDSGRMFYIVTDSRRDTAALYSASVRSVWLENGAFGGVELARQETDYSPGSERVSYFNAEGGAITAEEYEAAGHAGYGQDCIPCQLQISWIADTGVQKMREAGSLRSSLGDSCSGFALTALSDSRPDAAVPLRAAYTWADILAASEREEQDTASAARQTVSKALTGELLADQTLPGNERIVLFRPTDAADAETKYWAVDRGETWEVFCVEDARYSDGYRVSTYENVLGHDSFRIHGSRGAGYYFGDYYYFDENGSVRFLASGPNLTIEADLNGDGTKELLFLYHYQAGYVFLNDGAVYNCYLPGLVGRIGGWAWRDVNPDGGEDVEARIVEDRTLPVTLHRTDAQNVRCRAELRFTDAGIGLYAAAFD